MRSQFRIEWIPKLASPPVIEAAHYGHTFVWDRQGLDRRFDVMPAAQLNGYDPYGADWYDRGRVVNVGGSLHINEVNVVRRLIDPALGYEVEFTSAVDPLVPGWSFAEANCRFDIEPWVRDAGGKSVLAGSVQSDGECVAVPRFGSPGSDWFAYAFSHTAMRLGTWSNTGKIYWTPSLDVITTGGAVSRAISPVVVRCRLKGFEGPEVLPATPVVDMHYVAPKDVSITIGEDPGDPSRSRLVIDTAGAGGEQTEFVLDIGNTTDPNRQFTRQKARLRLVVENNLVKQADYSDPSNVLNAAVPAIGQPCVVTLKRDIGITYQMPVVGESGEGSPVPIGLRYIDPANPFGATATSRPAAACMTIFDLSTNAISLPAAGQR